MLLGFDQTLSMMCKKFKIEIIFILEEYQQKFIIVLSLMGYW